MVRIEAQMVLQLLVLSFEVPNQIYTSIYPFLLLKLNIDVATCHPLFTYKGQDLSNPTTQESWTRLRNICYHK